MPQRSDQSDEVFCVARRYQGYVCWFADWRGLDVSELILHFIFTDLMALTAGVVRPERAVMTLAFFPGMAAFD